MRFYIVLVLLVFHEGTFATEHLTVKSGNSIRFKCNSSGYGYCEWIYKSVVINFNTYIGDLPKDLILHENNCEIELKDVEHSEVDGMWSCVPKSEIGIIAPTQNFYLHVIEHPILVFKEITRNKSTLKVIIS